MYVCMYTGLYNCECMAAKLKLREKSYKEFLEDK